MQNTFDIFGLFERPQITLCNPDGRQLCSLGNAYNTQLSIKYNALSEFSFDLMQVIQDANNENVVDPAFALLKSKRLVLIENFGYFQIVTPTDIRKDGKLIKNIQCVSWEVELVSKQFTGFKFGGTTAAKFYDPTDNSKTFLGLILADTNWGIGQIDESLWDVYRNFDISANNCYNTLMIEAEKAYGCIFTFDPTSRLVNATSVAEASSLTNLTDIYLSFENLVKETSIKEISEEIVTAMNVQGGDGLDIRSVNPLGTNFIYDFSYYQTRDGDGNSIWITDELNDAIDTWQAKIASIQPEYIEDLSDLKDQYIQKGLYEVDLSILNDELSALIEIQKVQIEGGNTNLNDIDAQINTKNNEITVKETQIDATQSNIDGLLIQISDINQDLAITNVENFTLDEQSKLRSLTIQNLYQNNNIIITSIMTPDEIQEQALELYTQAQGVLSRAAIPRYEFSMSLVNFTALKEYIVFTNQLELGSLITIENEEGVHIITSVLEINLSFDDLTDFSMTFSNRLRLDNGSFIFSDILNGAASGATTVSFNSGPNAWGGYTENESNLLFLNTTLNAANNEIINSSKQEVSIGSYGLRGKRLLPSGLYSGNQIWITSNLISFSKDGFKTSSLALGQITLVDGTKAYGIAGSVILGDLIAGAQLRIRNSNNNFVLDSNGAVLTNASFTITSTNPSQPNDIVLSPSTGLVIRKRGLPTAVFSADSSGNLNITGIITATGGSFNGNVNMLSGTIGTTTQGLIVNSEGLYTKDLQNFALGDGRFRWGGLDINGSSATFSGTIYANRLRGNIVNNQIADNTITAGKIHDLNADTLTAGAIRGLAIYGSVISWGNTIDNPNAVMYGDDEVGLFKSKRNLQLYVSDSPTGAGVGASVFLEHVDDKYAVSIYAQGAADTSIGTNGTVYIGIGQNVIKMKGTLDLSELIGILTSSGLGYTGTLQVNSPAGVKTISITKGIITNIS